MAKTIHRPGYRRLIDALRERRLDLALAQQTVARRLGWPQQKLSLVEAGSRRIDVLEFLALAHVLGLSPAAALRLAESLARMPKPLAGPRRYARTKAAR